MHKFQPPGRIKIPLKWGEKLRLDLGRRGWKASWGENLKLLVQEVVPAAAGDATPAPPSPRKGLQI